MSVTAYNASTAAAAYLNQQRPSSQEMLIQMNRKLIFETPAPFISASSWVILDRTNGEILFAKNEFEER